MKPRIADLFCGAGGSGMGLYQAGFEVVGFDINPQPRYPFEFHQADALEIDLSGFDAVWASPPCQAYGQAKNITSSLNLVRLTSYKLNAFCLLYILENIPGAPIRADAKLCGEMFGLRTIRHRWFESNVELTKLAHLPHNGKAAQDLKEYQTLENFHYITVTSGRCPLKDGSIALGIDWMQLKELTQAIPPSYSKYLGKQLIEYAKVEAS